MKKLTRSLLVAGAMIAASSANAAFIDEICPLIGIDYQHVWTKGKGNWDQVFPKSFPGGSVYVGTRFCECLGLELGYDWSAKKSKDFSLANGTFFGASPGRTVTGTARVRRSGGHFDLIGYLPVADCLELMGVIGVGYVYPKITVSTVTQGDPLSSALQSVSGKGKAVARVRIGGSYMFTECVGVRALVGWESTSSLRVKGNSSFVNQNISNKAFKGSATAAGGLFVKF